MCKQRATLNSRTCSRHKGTIRAFLHLLLFIPIWAGRAFSVDGCTNVFRWLDRKTDAHCFPNDACGRQIKRAVIRIGPLGGPHLRPYLPPPSHCPCPACASTCSPPPAYPLPLPTPLRAVQTLQIEKYMPTARCFNRSPER